MKEKRTLHHWLHVRSTHAGRGPSSGGEVPGRAAQDTPRVHPCRLGFGHPWPNTVLGSPARHLADAKRPTPRVRLTVSKKPSGPFYKARFLGADLARERERSSRQDARDFSSFSANSLSGILPAGKAGLSRAGPARTRQAPPKPAATTPLSERFGASDNPERWNLPCERVCVLPFRDPGEQDVRQGAPRDGFTAFEVA